MRILRGLIVLCCLGVIAFGGWKIYEIESGYRQGEKTYEAMENYIVLPEPTEKETKPAAQPSSPTDPKESEPSVQAAEDPSFPLVDFHALALQNPDVVGWIYMEDSPINYPIAQGTDNDYYLEHLFNRAPNDTGCIFLDARNQPDFSGQHSLVFGHNMKTGTMFAHLMEYKMQQYLDEHPRFQLVTPAGNYYAEIFAGFVTGVDSRVWQLDFPDDEAYGAWLAEMQRQPGTHRNVKPTVHDRVLTLSTCTYEFDNARFVLMAILKEA